MQHENSLLGSTLPAFEFRSHFRVRQVSNTPIPPSTHVDVKIVFLKRVEDKFGKRIAHMLEKIVKRLQGLAAITKHDMPSTNSSMQKRNP